MEMIFDRFAYSDTDVIGVGGMGTVYRGTDTTSDGRLVAIKYLKPEIVQNNPAIVDRFRREGEALRDLNHPNIVQMLDAGMCGESHFIVMEFVPGGSLRDLLDNEIRLSVQRTLYIALDLADALTRAHRLNILHRDIKPANVLLAADGTPRLTDFGVARTQASHLTADGQIVGTMAYISPEALTDGKIDERHDIWAFGVLLFEMLAGHRPFRSENVGVLVNEITQQPIPDLEKIRPDAPVALVDLIYRMLDRNLETRIRSARLVGAELERIIYTGGTDSTPAGMMPREMANDRFRTTTTSQRVLDTPPPDDQPTAAAVGLVNVPAQATPFVGREAEVEAVRAQLRSDSVRLLTLVGTGGVGKTRLALAVAETVQDAFPDGVFFVPLASVENPEMVPLKIGEAVGFPSNGGSDDPMDDMIDFIRDKRALIIMDNLEHLIHGVGQLSNHMERAPHFKVLATSRERLRLRGEYVYEVDGMVVPPASIQDPDALLAYPAARLFMSSAERVAPGFTLDAANTPHVARIIQLVQGIPLGVELAAGWLEVLPVAEIASEIESSLDFLETDIRDIPERHRSIRAVFDYSWNLMTEAERETFMRLSVFRGSFERAAAQKITGASLRSLTSLVNKSLLARDADGRYSIGKLLRQYAEEQFHQHCPQPDDLYNAYVEHFTSFVEKIKTAFGTEHDQQALNSVDAELENLRHTLVLATDREMLGHIERLVMPMSEYYFSRSMLAEADTAFTHIGTRLMERGHDNTQAFWQTKSLLAAILARRGDYIRAEQMATKVLAKLSETFQDDPMYTYARAYTLNQLAYAQMFLGRYEAARANIHAALALAEGHADDWGMVLPGIYGNQGYLEFLAGNLDEAERIFTDLTNTLYSEDRSPIGYAYICNNLGEIRQAQGAYADAERLYETAYTVFKRYHQRRGMAVAANNIARCHAMRGAYDQAQDLYRKAYQINREIGDRAGLGHSLSAMANIAIYEQNYHEALDYFTQALTLRREIGDRIGYTHSLTDVGMVLYMLGRVDEARPYYLEAQPLAEELDNSALRAFTALGIGAIRLFDGDSAAAMEQFQLALRHMGTTDHNVAALLFVAASVAMILTERGLYEKAAQVVGFVEARAEEAAGVHHEARPLTRPILQNIEHELQHQLGTGFGRARAHGRTLALDSVLQEVFVV